MPGYVAIECSGHVEVHAEAGNGSTYASLCGLDDHDPSVGLRRALLPVGARIDCPDCIAIIRQAKKYRSRDIAAGK